LIVSLRHVFKQTEFSWQEVNYAFTALGSSLDEIEFK